MPDVMMSGNNDDKSYKIWQLVHDQLCEPCLRDNDHEEALNYCLQCYAYLCKLCTKYHKKSWHPLATAYLKK